MATRPNQWLQGQTNGYTVKPMFRPQTLSPLPPASTPRQGLRTVEAFFLHDNYYVRPRIEFNKGNIPNVKMLNELIDIGFRKFLIPKISQLDELKYMQKALSNRWEPINAPCSIL